MEKSKKDTEDVEMEEEAGNDKAEGGDEAKPKQQAQKDKDLLTFEGMCEEQSERLRVN
jgi:hypothetical protein